MNFHGRPFRLSSPQKRGSSVSVILVLRRPCSHQTRLPRGRDPSKNARVFGGGYWGREGSGRFRVHRSKGQSVCQGQPPVSVAPLAASERTFWFLFGAQPKGTRRHGSTKSGVAGVDPCATRAQNRNRSIQYLSGIVPLILPLDKKKKGRVTYI